jgi:tRNA pseudouridine38-40 synthase
MTPPELDEGVVRLRLDVAYDGTDFSGWASQPGLRTVQGVIEDALATILRLSVVSLTVAGRTDAGVHARGQVCHVDLPRAVLERSELPRLTSRLTRLLTDDVRVRRIEVAPAGFDARFSATWRRYTYRMCDSPRAADPLTRRHTLPWPRRLDETAMNAAAARLLGEHDFAAFCRRRAGATTVRALSRLEFGRLDDLVTASVVADAFCHSMVRSLVGCLVSVGEGRQPVEWPASVLSAGCRDSRVKVIPALGLTLEEVGYPADRELARRASQTRRLREPAPPGGR